MNHSRPESIVDSPIAAKPLVDLSTISAAIRSYPFPKADLILGIARGGTFPAILIAHELGLPFRSIQVNYRNERNQPQREAPEFLSSLQLPPLSSHATILLVDDVSVTGKTLDKVRQALPDYHVITLVLKGKADHVLLPHLNTCVTWPWHASQNILPHEG
ncbi:phosphoribosyltransferase [Lunatimonas salinarum]|uniref:phosphoribosyltransferase n=1 Tax=Lunatimonas salinarum TaxID=1774590 RepID=UPI001AE060B9|nr:phosphoribosyltransferase [Lunatimonas salinarum]